MMVFTALTIILFSKPTWQVNVALAVAFVLGVGVLWNDYVREQPTEDRFTIIRHKLKKHQDARISGWLDPTADLKGSNYHSMQSKIAVGSGGRWGKGWMKGTQTGLRYLPEQHTDFIFSVFAEEQGFLRALGLLVLYGVLLLGGLAVALTAKERYGAFVAIGICAMIFWQVFENIGMVTGLLPITGITLPLMSYGGSSMVSVMIGLGLLVNVALKRQRAGLG
jgi:rod shape determining protein RodA